MNFSALSLLETFEGVVKRNGKHIAYRDQAGLWTIGYGHLVKSGERFPQDGITDEEAAEILRSDLAETEEAIKRLVEVPLTQNQYDALVSFVFNIGIGAFMASTVLKRLNKGNYQGAADALLWWHKVRDPETKGLVTSDGLKSRRSHERALFLKGD